MTVVTIGDATLMLGDCMERMAEIPDGSVDLVLCDLPYGTTQNAWDAVIPFEALWAHYWRVLKPNGAAVLTAAQPFTRALVMSQAKAFRYQWVWEKSNATGFLNAQKQPLRAHEDVLVFYLQQPTFNPQMVLGEAYKKSTGVKSSANYGVQSSLNERSYDGMRYPRTVQRIPSVVRAESAHPTQKPVALMEYLIRTYTHEGETVLDNCFGSGTTGVAAIQLGRKFIGIEREEKYFDIAVRRIEQAAKQGQLFQPEPAKQIQDALL